MTSIESQESSSPIITRAVAAGLREEFCDNYLFPGWQKTLLSALGSLPQGIGRYFISRFQTISGLPPQVLDGFSIDTLISERLHDYADLQGPYPTITVGVAQGGPSSYLSLASGGPFLPQAFVVTIKHGSKDGNVSEYLHRSLEAALRIAADNPSLLTIQHFDPVHDGWLTRFINHLRFKLLTLPDSYKDFIRSRLRPGGTIVFLDGGATWLRYRVGPRSVFQVGGWGGIPPEEFLDGSERLKDYAKKAGLKYAGWKLDDYPLERGAESEWGSEPGFGGSLESFCRQEGYRFLPIHLPHPNDLSRLAFTAARKLLEKEGRSPAGVLVEMFSQFDATSALQGSLLPLWLVFNTEDSRQFLEEMVAEFPAGKPVFFSPLSTFSLTPDIVPFAAWASVLKAFPWENIGARANHYPSDSRALVQWAEPLRSWVTKNKQPIRSLLTPDEILELADKTISKPF